MKTALVCIAKDEDLYIDEWINYHLKLGFTHIYIYQNDWRYKLDFISDNVTFLKFDGYLQQNAAYNHFINKNYWNYDWAVFFDVDEFLVLKQHKTVSEFLNQYCEFEAVGINWAIFGNNGLETTNGDFSVIKRFTKRKKNPYLAIKSIVRLSIPRDKLPNFSNPHYINSEWVDTKFQKNSGPSSKEPTDDIAQINHYYCKTPQEFISKCKRGRAASRNLLTMDDYEVFNINEVEDFFAYNFLYKGG